MLLFLSLGMSLMGLTFGPMSALLPELFPTNTRYTGSGIAYNVASILGAALTPFVATWLAASHGAGSVGVYLACLGASTLVGPDPEPGNARDKSRHHGAGHDSRRRHRGDLTLEAQFHAKFCLGKPGVAQTSPALVTP